MSPGNVGHMGEGSWDLAGPVLELLHAALRVGLHTEVFTHHSL